MIDLDVFLPKVMTKAAGCAEPTAINALREAAMEFCERTRAWRSTDTFDVTPETCAFVCVPEQAELYEIELVTFNGVPLDAASNMELDRLSTRWRDNDDSTTGSPRYYTQLSMDTIQIVPKASGEVVVYTFLKPAEEAEQVPDFLANKYRRVIVSGALAELLLMPGQPFFSPDLAGFHRAKFEAALNGNFDLNVRGQQRAPTRTRAQFL